MRIVLHKTANMRNAPHTGMGGTVVFQGMNEVIDCVIFGVIFANGRTALILMMATNIRYLIDASRVKNCMTTIP